LENDKQNKLKVVNWFRFDKEKREKIIGGNSRVLVEATNNQFWFDTENNRIDVHDPTIFEKVNVTDLTTLDIYSGGSKTFRLRNSYFQYVSLSQDQLSMSAFVFHGYEKSSV
jgi:hypothetical protein